jgi:hypothetical protein
MTPDMQTELSVLQSAQTSVSKIDFRCVRKNAKIAHLKKSLLNEDNPSDLKLNMQAEVLLDLLIGINFSQIFKQKPLVLQSAHPISLQRPRVKGNKKG